MIRGKLGSSKLLTVPERRASAHYRAPRRLGFDDLIAVDDLRYRAFSSGIYDPCTMLPVFVPHVQLQMNKMDDIATAGGMSTHGTTETQEHPLQRSGSEGLADGGRDDFRSSSTCLTCGRSTGPSIWLGFEHTYPTCGSTGRPSIKDAQAGIFGSMATLHPRYAGLSERLCQRRF